MFAIVCLLRSSLRSCLSTRAALQAEILVLRHQRLVVQRSTRGHRLRLKPADRVFGVWLSRLWEWLAFGGESCKAGDNYRLEFAGGFRLYWTWEESSARWSSANKSRGSRSDTKDESGQSTLGAHLEFMVNSSSSESISAKPLVPNT